MKITRRQLDVLTHASPDPQRQALTGVYIDKGRAIATDGHRLAIMERIEAEPCDDQAIIPISAAKAINKSLPKVSKKKPIHLEAVATVNCEKINFKVPTNDGMSITESKKVGGVYPNYNQVTPNPDDLPLKVGINAAYLRDVCEMALKGRDGFKPMCLAFHFKEDEFSDNPVLITFQDHDGEHSGKAVIMPVRTY